MGSELQTALNLRSRRAVGECIIHLEAHRCPELLESVLVTGALRKGAREVDRHADMNRCGHLLSRGIDLPGERLRRSSHLNRADERTVGKAGIAERERRGRGGSVGLAAEGPYQLMFVEGPLEGLPEGGFHG